MEKLFQQAFWQHLYHSLGQIGHAPVEEVKLSCYIEQSGAGFEVGDWILVVVERKIRTDCGLVSKARHAIERYMQPPWSFYKLC
jgi:hypothetical protein